VFLLQKDLFLINTKVKPRHFILLQQMSEKSLKVKLRENGQTWPTNTLAQQDGI